VSPKQIYRILDANLNRSREGLRVCEEVARFVLQNKSVTRQIKTARHSITCCIEKMPVPLTELVSARNVRSDVGKESSFLENGKKDARGLFLANAERSKEALRVLEEVSKLVDVKLSARFKRIRFQVYAIEKRTLPRLEALHHHG